MEKEVLGSLKYLKFEIRPSFCQSDLLILMPYSHLQQTLELRFKLQGVFIVILTLCFLSTFILFSTRLRLPIPGSADPIGRRRA